MNLCWSKMAISRGTLRESTGAAMHAPVSPNLRSALSVCGDVAVRWAGGAAERCGGLAQPAAWAIALWEMCIYGYMDGSVGCARVYYRR